MANELIKHVTHIDFDVEHLVIDIRGVKQFALGHIPGSINLPFSQTTLTDKRSIDMWRKAVFKLNNTFRSVILVGGSKTDLVKAAREALKVNFDTYIYKGGYTRFRKWVAIQLKQQKNVFTLTGKTGSGKTLLLEKLKDKVATLPLSELAAHHGSVFGDIPTSQSCRQQQFENQIAVHLSHVNRYQPLLTETEGDRIGSLLIPETVRKMILTGIPIYIDVAKSIRIDRLVALYARKDDQKLCQAIHKLSNIFALKERERLCKLVAEQKYREVAGSLINYYDRTEAYLRTEKQETEFFVCGDDLDEASVEIENILQKKTSSEEDAL